MFVSLSVFCVGSFPSSVVVCDEEDEEEVEGDSLLEEDSGDVWEEVKMVLKERENCSCLGEGLEEREDGWLLQKLRLRSRSMQMDERETRLSD